MRKILLGRNPHLDSLRMGYRHMRPGQSLHMRIHRHDCSEIVVILHDGGATHWADGKPCALARGDILLMHPGSSHMYGDPDQLELVNLLYEAEQLPLPPLDGAEMKLFRAFCDPHWRSPAPERPLVHLDDRAMAEVEVLLGLLEPEFASEAPGRHLCAFGLFVALLVHLSRAGGRAEHGELLVSAMRALHFLNLHFQEKISVEQLMKMCHLSRAGLFRHFRALTGYSPLEYQRQKRLELAETLLRTTEQDLNTVATACGFCDSNHLTRLFTRRYKAAPGRYRKQLRQQRETDRSGKTRAGTNRI